MAFSIRDFSSENSKNEQRRLTMYANGVSRLNTLAWNRNFEVALYALVACVMIGHVYFIQGRIHLGNALSVLVGMVFGFIAAFQLAPVTDFFANSENRISASVLSIVWDDEEKDSASIDTKNAA
jgi:hypothetical protein